MPTPRWKGGRVAIGIALVALGVMVVAATDFGRFWSPERLQVRLDEWLQFAHEHPAAAGTAFVLVYTVGTALALPGMAAVSVAGGVIFGAFLGSGYVVLGATSGATLAFLAARCCFRDAVADRLGTRLEQWKQGFERNAGYYLLVLRLFPLVPFSLLNLLAGLTHVRLGTYVLVTALGITPGAFAYALAGQELGRAASAREVLTPRLLFALSLLGLLALGPIVGKRLRVRGRTGSRGSENEPRSSPPGVAARR